MTAAGPIRGGAAPPAVVALWAALATVAVATGCRSPRVDRRQPPSSAASVADASSADAVLGKTDGAVPDVAPTAGPTDVPPLVVRGAAVPSRVGTLDACRGCRLARRPDAPAAPEGGIGPGTPLYARDLLETPPDEAADLTLTDGRRLRLWPGSRLLLGLQRPADLGLSQGGLTASEVPPRGGPLRLFTPAGAIEPLAGRFVARIAAGGRGLLFLAPDASEERPPRLVDGLGGETPLVRGLLHVLGPSTLPATSRPLTWEPGTAAPEASVEEARVELEARTVATADDRPATVLALARGLGDDLEALEAARAENRRLLAELERRDRPPTERDTVREALRESARRSLEAERAVAHRWFRLEMVIGATGVTTTAPWTLHAASGLQRWRGRVEALLGGGVPPGENGTRAPEGPDPSRNRAEPGGSDGERP